MLHVMAVITTLLCALLSVVLYQRSQHTAGDAMGGLQPLLLSITFAFLALMSLFLTAVTG